MPQTASPTQQSPYWLAARGARQMDLACRFSAAAQLEGLRTIALKGVSIAGELYGGFENRPMADVDLLVVDTGLFEAAGQVARSMGLVETGASDHALVFKEGETGVVVELHIALTSCPGLFRVQPDRLWERRKQVAGTTLLRLGDEDLILHLALHTAFQHAFAANAYHYDDFTRALRQLDPRVDRLRERAKEWGATSALGSMAEAVYRHSGGRPGVLPEQIEPLRRLCPGGLVRWIRAQPRFPPEISLRSLATVRHRLSPSHLGYLARALFPAKIPGSTLPRPGTLHRLSNLARVGVAARFRSGPVS